MTVMSVWFGIPALNAVFIATAAIVARREEIALDLRSATAAAILFLGLAAQMMMVAMRGETLTVAGLIVAVAAATVCAATDAGTGYVFDVVTLPALATICGIAFAQHELPAAFYGALAAGGAMAALYVLTLGRGLGFGDVKLACCVGGGLGIHDGILALALAFVLGGAYAAFLLLTRRGVPGDSVRFAPYLATGLATLALLRSAS